MPIARNNFSGALTAAEFEGVDVSLITIAAGDDISGETGDFQAGSASAGLQIIRQTIENNGFNILGNGVLQNSDQDFTALVRTDAIEELGGTSTVAVLQTAIRAAHTAHNGNTPGITADLSGATVGIKALYSTT